MEKENFGTNLQGQDLRVCTFLHTVYTCTCSDVIVCVLQFSGGYIPSHCEQLRGETEGIV